MPTTTAQIDLWRGEPSESQILEFKEAKANFDRDKLAQYCVAIANEGGGHLLLGVANPPPRPVVGSLAFPDLIHTANEIFFNE
jgi:ATP-dependent DNA helicase RecG